MKDSLHWDLESRVFGLANESSQLDLLAQSQSRLREEVST